MRLSPRLKHGNKSCNNVAIKRKRSCQIYFEDVGKEKYKLLRIIFNLSFELEEIALKRWALVFCNKPNREQFFVRFKDIVYF